MAARRTARRGTRARTVWSGFVATGLTAIPAASKVLITAFEPTFTASETVRRIRGTAYVISDQDTLDEGFHGAIGAAVVGDLAVAAGVASIKDPVTDVNDESWLWYQSFSGFADNTRRAAGASLLMIDSRGQRKVEGGNSLVFVVANASATTGFSIALSLRILTSEMVA